MGSRLQAGAGGSLSFRIRALAIAAGIVAVSLLLSGVLTWVLVRGLEEQNTKDNLERIALLSAVQVSQLSVGTRTQIELADLLTNNANPPALGDNRLIVLQRQSMNVLYDSGGQLQFGTALPMSAPDRQFVSGDATIGDTTYVYGYSRNGARGYGVMVLRPKAAVAAAASRQLLPNLLIAGGISLLIALVLMMLVTRAMVRPLTELAAASEDIAQGNYGRRVRFVGRDEIGIVGAAFNRMAEAVERARQAQREFLANVSHELKTPLTSLIGFSQALVEGNLTPSEEQRAATIVHEESERMLRMSQELLDLARVEAGQVPITIQPVDLVAMLHQEMDLMRKRAEERKLHLELEASPSSAPALADPERLHQILDNLLDNAVKYAPTATSVVVTLAPLGRDRLELQVVNPIGSHRPDPERMFDRFYRAEPSRSTAAGGVGLGLAISRELAARMGGRLWADFNRDGWLRLRLELPAAGPTASDVATGSTVRLPRPGASETAAFSALRSPRVRGRR